jgi:hypothetical protein
LGGARYIAYWRFDTVLHDCKMTRIAQHLAPGSWTPCWGSISPAAALPLLKKSVVMRPLPGPESLGPGPGGQGQCCCCCFYCAPGATTHTRTRTGVCIQSGGCCWFCDNRARGRGGRNCFEARRPQLGGGEIAPNCLHLQPVRPGKRLPMWLPCSRSPRHGVCQHSAGRSFTYVCLACRHAGPWTIWFHMCLI